MSVRLIVAAVSGSVEFVWGGEFVWVAAAEARPAVPASVSCAWQEAFVRAPWPEAR